MKCTRVSRLHDEMQREAIESLTAEELEAYLTPLDRWGIARGGRSVDDLSWNELERAAAGSDVPGFTATPLFDPEQITEAPDGSRTWRGHRIASAEEWAGFRGVCARLGWTI